MELFIAKSIAIQGLLLGIYYLLLSREKMHRFNRYYLLGALVVSFAIPLLSIPVYIEVNNVVAESNTTIVPMPVAVTPVIASIAPAVESKVNYLPYVLWGIYGLVTLVLLVRLVVNIGHFYRKASRNKRVVLNGATVVLLNDCPLPYTFMNFIFVNEADYEGRTIEAELLTHELAHVRQKHTLDILFIELLKTMFWFNPLLYLYKKAIQTNHEFLADEAVISQHINIPTYQLLLLDKATPPLAYALASSINFSTTKKRFTMMTKTTTRFKAALLQAATVPVMAALVLLFSVKAEAQKAQAPEVKSVKINKFSATQLDSVKKANPGLLDDKIADNEYYGKIETTTKDKKGNDHVEVKYIRSVDEPQQLDGFKRLAKIDAKQIKAIDVSSPNQAQFDSLVAAEPARFKGKELGDVKRLDVKYMEDDQLKSFHFYQYSGEKPAATSEIIEAEYPGGLVAFYKTILQDMKLPEIKGTGDTVQVKFILSFDIDKKGNLLNISAIKDPRQINSFSEDVEADIIAQIKKITKKSPKWEPARRNGKRIASHKDLPITVSIKE